ncbi:hypothetical protein EMCRGX_G019157 [Ephydatia muelleri]
MGSHALKIVALCVTWYLLSAANNVIGKQILTVFPYPVTLSMVNLAGLAFGLGPSLSALQVAPAPHISRKVYTRRIIPLALGKVLASVAAHVSVWKVSVSYAHTVKASMPLFTVLLSAVVLNETYPLKVYLSLAPIVLGVILASVTEISFDLVGMLAALLSTLAISLQNIYSKKCMREAHIHHQRLLLVLSQAACFFLFPFWMYMDVWDLTSQLHKVQHLGWLFLAVPVSGCLNFAQNIVAFTMISAVSPNPVTLYNVLGMGVAISGVLIYNKIKYSASRHVKPVLPYQLNESSVDSSLLHDRTH